MRNCEVKRGIGEREMMSGIIDRKVLKWARHLGRMDGKRRQTKRVD